VKYADGLVILAKEETVLQGMIAKLSEIGSCFGVEVKVEKLWTISRQISPIQTMTDQKQPALCGAEKWILRKLDKKFLQSF